MDFSLGGRQSLGRTAQPFKKQRLVAAPGLLRRLVSCWATGEPQHVPHADRRVLHEPMRKPQRSLTSALDPLAREAQLQSSSRAHGPFLQKALCVVGLEQVEGRRSSAFALAVEGKRNPCLHDAIVSPEACMQQQTLAGGERASPSQRVRRRHSAQAGASGTSSRAEQGERRGAARGGETRRPQWRAREPSPPGQLVLHRTPTALWLSRSPQAACGSAQSPLAARRG